jgi:multidrug efflux system outer membrane protein
MVRIALIVAALSLFVSGCAGWRPVRQPDLEAPPEAFLNAEVLSEYSDDPWWQVLGDPVLDSLELELFSHNLSLEQAVARMDQSRASLVSARSGWFPFVTAQGSVRESGEVEENPTPTTALEQPRYSGSMAATYEIDIWGKIAAGSAAAKAGWLASEEDLRALTLTMSAQLARSYYLIAELQQQKELLDQTVASYKDSYNLVLSRYYRGIVSSQDVYQARTNLAGAEAQSTLIRSTLKTAEHSLAVLLNRYPRDGIMPANTAIPRTIAPVPVGLPNDLIDRRPDVRSAYYRLVSADKNAAEAVAARWPSFSLNGSVDSSSDDLQDVLNPENMIWNALGGITAPLFQGGRLKANADRAEAVWRESLAGYKATVLEAYQDVEDALVRTKLLNQYVLQLEEQVSAAESSLRLANQNYLRGIVDYLTVVTAQAIYFNARRNLISAQRDLVGNHIDLAVSLGGGWTDEVIDQYLLTEN